MGYHLSVHFCYGHWKTQRPIGHHTGLYLKGPGSISGQLKVLLSRVRHCTLTVPLSRQEYKRVPANCQGAYQNVGG